MKNCVHCGAELPDEANLCPFCAGLQAEPKEKTPPRLWRRTLAIVVGIVLLFLALAAAIRLYHAPKDYRTEGSEILYSDRDGSVKVFLSWQSGSATQESGVAEKTFSIVEGSKSRLPSCLYVYDPERRVNLQSEFTDKIAEVRVTAVPHDGAEAVEIFTPSYTPDFPFSALVSDVLYNAYCGTNDIVWSLVMKNGDTITLQQQLTIERQKAASYTSDTWPMENMEQLQSLLKQIEETEDPETMVTVYLPAVTYEGGLHFNTRSFKLVGSTSGDRQTTFTGGCTVELRKPQIAEFESIAFVGHGTGTGISASEGVILLDCRVAGWEIGANAQQGSWIAAFGTTFEENGIGLQFDSISSSMVYPTYEFDSFLNNGTAVSLLRVPQTQELSFPGCVFSGNETDFYNPAGRSVNTQDAAFDP